MSGSHTRSHSPHATDITMPPRKRGKNSDAHPAEFTIEERNVNRQYKSVAILASIFVASVLLIYIVYRNFPALPAEHRSKLKLPRNMDEAKQLGEVLEIYEKEYYYEVLVSFFLIYIFLQTFAIPGSIFLSILSGALFPFSVALFAVCLCSSIGATNCYFLSHLFGKNLVVKYFPEQLRQAQTHVVAHEEHLTYYIVFLRITPFLPNWLINIACPVIGVGLFPFFVGTFFGVGPPSMFFIQAGQMLHQLTHTNQVMSPRTLLLLIAMGFVSLAPIVLKKKLAKYF